MNRLQSIILGTAAAMAFSAVPAGAASITIGDLTLNTTPTEAIRSQTSIHA